MHPLVSKLDNIWEISVSSHDSLRAAMPPKPMPTSSQPLSWSVSVRIAQRRQRRQLKIFFALGFSLSARIVGGEEERIGR